MPSDLREISLFLLTKYAVTLNYSGGHFYTAKKNLRLKKNENPVCLIGMLHFHCPREHSIRRTVTLDKGLMP